MQIFAMKKIVISATILCTLTVVAQQKSDTIKKENETQEVAIVASSRTQQKNESSPHKVESLGKGEMTQQSSIKPVEIGSDLGDIGGVQIQQSSAISGNSNIRIQGLDGRYT